MRIHFLTNHTQSDRKKKRKKKENTGPAIPSAGSVITVVAGVAAAWIAAGSTGLLSHPLRHCLTWIACGIAVIASWPCPGGQSWKRVILLAAGAAAGVIMTVSALPVVNVLAVALLLGVMAIGKPGVEKRVILSAAASVVLFALYRLVNTSIPLVWLVSDGLGGMLGRICGSITGEPLWVGATFAGLDFLVLMAAFYLCWLINTPPPRSGRAIYGACAILGGHLLYLIVLAFAARLLRVAPAPPPPPADMLSGPSVGAAWSWGAFFRLAVPWNLPILAAMINLVIAGAMLRWSKWVSEAPFSLPGRGHLLFLTAAGLLAVMLPVATTLCTSRPEIRGKKIVLFEQGFLNWLKPTYGDYGHLSIGMYGMLPSYIESLGARCVISADLSENDLQGADALILIFPNEPWAAGQLDRIWNFVRRGGSLMVLGEHTIRESDGGNRFNEVLQPTSMKVRFDSATFAVGGWLHSYEALAHPVTSGISDEHNHFGVVIGASVEARWPARPILIGRWGWADPGDEGSSRAMMGNDRYDAGEKLGDLILASEQRLGAGKIITFGDTSSMSNGITIGDWVFTSRLLGYLADKSIGSPQTLWRGVIGLLMAMILAILLMTALLGDREANPSVIILLILVPALLSASLSVCSWASHRAGRILPDGRGRSPNNLAYIDSSHLEVYSSEGWREDGIMGLSMTLMRSGYLTLMLPEVTPEQLERAGLLVSVAPMRSFTCPEISAIRTFIEQGGIFILTAGYGESAVNLKPLLSEFGFRIGEGASPSDRQDREPSPMGFFKAPYLQNGEKRAYVRFYAAWPVACDDPKAQVIAYGHNDLPMIITRPVGRGKMVLIGDTCFAMNKNLEHENGAPFDGMYENADFWRWFLSYLKNQRSSWLPQQVQDNGDSESEKIRSESLSNSEVSQ